MYFRRYLENEILHHKTDDYIVLILGARQTGKTTLLKEIFHILEKEGNCFFVNLENPEYKRLLDEHPQNLYKIIGTFSLQSRYAVCIDEIQHLDNPSNFLKFIYDEYREKTKLIVTGSSSFYIDRKFRDSLLGRKKIFYLYSLNFGEFLLFKKEHELYEILSLHSPLPLRLKDKFEWLFEEYVTFGSYPRVVLASDAAEKKEILENMAFDYIKKDIFEARIQNEEKYFHLLKILASQCGNLVNVNELAHTLGLSQPTIEHYLYVMQKSFHIAMISPFYKNIRKELTKMRKVFFYDLGLRNQLLNNFNQIELREDKGAILENLFFREMLFNEKLDAIKYWRTLNKNEVDFVIGQDKAYEIKFRKGDFKESKYKAFRKTFPNIFLEMVTYERVKKEFLYI